MTPDELKAAIAELDPIGPIEPGHNWAFWAYDLRQNILNNDPAEFLTWPGVVGTMFVGNAPYIDFEFGKLPRSYFEILDEPGIGKPDVYREYTSGNLVHQAYHLWQWDQYHPWKYSDSIGAKIGHCVKSLDTIVEVGGGYGAMALIINRLGFKGRYIILDLPEFSLLQKYYLSSVGVEGVEFKTQIDTSIDCDLLIGLYSLTEMPLAAREEIIDLCPAQSYLIAYGENWGGWDNLAWATNLMRRKGYLWHNWNIEHLPNCWYLVGG